MSNLSYYTTVMTKLLDNFIIFFKKIQQKVPGDITGY